MTRPAGLDIYRTAIPMRSFEHAAARRSVAEAIVVRLQCDDGIVGWGETLPRPYVTGETLDTVSADLENILWPAVKAMALEDFTSELLPLAHEGRCLNAAACAMELALMDSGLLPWPGDKPGGSWPITARISGVLGSADPARTARRLMLMRLYGLRDFKLKLGFGDEVDRENLRVILRKIGKAVAAGRCTFRVDVNGGWDVATAPDRAAALKTFGVCVIEQPVTCPAAELVELARRCPLPLMADESLLTMNDANTLAAEPSIWWNIRLSKNGGLAQAKALAELASQKGIPFVIGCMVGESGILSAAQRRLLEVIPPPRFVEGNYGRFLLADDLTSPSPRFGCGGRLKPLGGGSSFLGARVGEKKIQNYGTLIKTLR